MITSRYATLHDFELILDEAEKGNAETRWNFTFDRDAGHDHVWKLIENETSDILIVERDGVPAGGAVVSLSYEFFDRPFAIVSKFWIIREHRRGDASHVLIETIQDWAYAHGCSHLFAAANGRLNKVEQMLFCRLMKKHGLEDVGPDFALKL